MAAHGINMLHFVPSSLRRDPAVILANLNGAIQRGNARPPLPIHALALLP